MAAESNNLPSKDHLDAMSEQELINHYNSFVSGNNIVAGATFWLEELERRRSTKIEETMRRLTWAIFVLTAINVVVVVAISVG